MRRTCEKRETIMMIIEKSRMKYLLGSKSISVRRTRRLKVDRLIGGRCSLLVPPRTRQGIAANGRAINQVSQVP